MQHPDLTKRLNTENRVEYYDYYISLLESEHEELERQISSGSHESELQKIELKKRSVELLREIEIKKSVRDRIKEKIKRDKERHKDLDKDFKKRGKSIIEEAKKLDRPVIKNLIKQVEKEQKKEKKLDSYHQLLMMLGDGQS